MYVNRSYLRELFRKLVADQCSEEELSEFLRLMRSLPNHDPLVDELEKHWQVVSNRDNKPDDAIGERIHECIISSIRQTGEEAGYMAVSSDDEVLPLSATIPLFAPRRKSMWGWWAAAVVFFIAMVGVYLLVMDNSKRMIERTADAVAEEIRPGKSGAILTLADGTELVLDSAGNGVLAMQHNTQVMLKNGQVVYEAPKNWSGEVLYNSMSTPKGRQFQLELPDGTHVWLNAQSAIRYPTVFSGAERIVEITGEAYFEVAKYKQLPFKVRVGNQVEVNALGTQFNIKAYDNEEGLNATLVEGSVSVRSMTGNPHTVILHPSEQAFVSPSSGSIMVKQADVEKVMAWKNGYFNFEETSFKDILLQLERWYDIDVVLEGDVPDIRFFGEMSKNVQLADLLEGLEGSGVRFRIEAGRRLVVTQ